MRCLRVTVLQSYRSHVWAGTSAGVVLTIPSLRVPRDSADHGLSIPQVHASYHGHTGPVRFITAVECKPKVVADAAGEKIWSDHSPNTSRRSTGVSDHAEQRDAGQTATAGSGSSNRDSVCSVGSLVVMGSLASSLLLPGLPGASLAMRQPSVTPPEPVAEETDEQSQYSEYTPLTDVNMLVVAGGDGYEDFKAAPMADNDTYEEGGSHMLVWEIS